MWKGAIAPFFLCLKIIENKFGSYKLITYLCPVVIRKTTGGYQKMAREYTPTYLIFFFNNLQRYNIIFIYPNLFAYLD
jgi:hypothetical protein